MAIEYSIKKGSPENERSQINTILEDIRRNIAASGGNVDYVTQQQLQAILNSLPPAGLNSVSTDNSIEGTGTSGNPIQLVNDEASPGNGEYYGTDGSGTKGFHLLPTTLSGTYTPTATVVDGSGATPSLAQWLRVGNTVTVSGSIVINSTGTFLIRLTLPVTSDFGATSDCCGTMAAIESTVQATAVKAHASSNQAELEYLAGFNGILEWFYTYTYRVI